MTQRKLILIFCILCTGAVSLGQTAFHIQTIKKGNSLLFPVFTSSVNPAAAKRINQMLQLSELEQLIKPGTKNIFSKIAADSENMNGSKDISFDIIGKNPKLLQMIFNEFSCGGTCYTWSQYYHFNTGNGDQIQLKDLFTGPGFNILRKAILKKRTAKFKHEILKLDSADREILSDVLDCYQTDSLPDYYILGDTIYIDGENCLSKSEKTYDLYLETEITAAEFMKYLNPYGRAVFGFSNEAIASFHSYSLPQLFKGSIGNAPILLILQNKGEAGIYAYLKYGQGINVYGTVTGHRLSLKEDIGDADDGGWIDADYTGRKLSGTWSNNNKTVTKKFVAGKE